MDEPRGGGKQATLPDSQRMVPKSQASIPESNCVLATLIFRGCIDFRLGSKPQAPPGSCFLRSQAQW